MANIVGLLLIVVAGPHASLQAQEDQEFPIMVNYPLVGIEANAMNTIGVYRLWRKSIDKAHAPQTKGGRIGQTFSIDLLFGFILGHWYHDGFGHSARWLEVMHDNGWKLWENLNGDYYHAGTLRGLGSLHHTEKRTYDSVANKITFRFYKLGSPIAVNGVDQAFLTLERTPDEAMLFRGAGLESNQYLAYLVSMQAHRGKEIFYSDLFLYLGNKLILHTYDLGVIPPHRVDPGQYAEFLDNKYPGRWRNKQALVTWTSLWNLVDPFLWRNFKRAGSYFGTGQRAFDVAEDWTWGTRYNLSPFGPEFYLDVFSWLGGNQLSGYIRSAPIFTSAWGLGGEFSRRLPFRNMDGSLGFDLWFQNDLQFSSSNRREYNGGSIFGTIKLPVSNTLDLAAKAGYKTDGFLMAQPVKEGAYGYSGIVLHF